MKDMTEYNRKRRFTRTKEPRGAVATSRTTRLRFVVQHHIARRDHFDFRLEWDGALKSWAVPKGPSYNSRDKRLAVEVEDHPLDYRTFEGTIPKGEYGGGAVMIWDEGYWLPDGDPGDGLANGSLKFTLDGDRLRGKWALVRMKAKPDDKNVNWLLIKEKDEFENAFDISRFTTSVVTGRTMEEIEAGSPEDPGDEEESDVKPAPSRKRTPRKKIPSLDDFTISNPDKDLYDQGITKGDVARYYLAVSERMLPYVENRILSAVRCPSGIDKPCFYKKHPAKETPGLVAVTVPSSEGKKEQYYYIEDIRGVMAEVQMNTLEFHTWGCRADRFEKPDVMVFDLDPAEGMGLDRIRQGVRDVKGLLDQLSLTSFLKTSGGKGYHVVIPFRASASWDAFHSFAQNIAKTMEAMWPDRYTSNVRKNKRTNRIFIDWMRNGRGATSVAPYSLRARAGAPVSMPIAWKELDTVTPNEITMKDAPGRLRRKDPWEGFFTLDQQLK